MRSIAQKIRYTLGMYVCKMRWNKQKITFIIPVGFSTQSGFRLRGMAEMFQPLLKIARHFFRNETDIYETRCTSERGCLTALCQQQTLAQLKVNDGQNYKLKTQIVWKQNLCLLRRDGFGLLQLAFYFRSLLIISVSHSNITSWWVLFYIITDRNDERNYSQTKGLEPVALWRCI